MFVHGGAEDSRTWTPQLDALSDEFGLSDYADCLAGMMRALGVSPTTIVGLSWGTTVILEQSRRHPDVVAGMVVADGYAGWRRSLGAEEADARLAGVRAAMAEPDEQFDPTLPGLFAGDPPARFVPLLKAMAVAREFERRIPGASLAVIPDCGHVSNLEAPQSFNEVVRSFLDKQG